MKNATFPFPEAYLDWLKNRSRETGLTQADIIRRAIDHYRDFLVMKEKEKDEVGFTPRQRQEIKRIVYQNLRLVRKS